MFILALLLLPEKTGPKKYRKEQCQIAYWLCSLLGVLRLQIPEVSNQFWVYFYRWHKIVVQFHFFHVVVYFSQHHLFKKLSFPYYIVLLPPLSLINWPYMCKGFFSRLSILLHWPMFLSLCQYHTIFHYYSFVVSFKSESVMPPALLFLKNTFAIWRPWWFHTNSRFLSCSSGKMPLAFW